jgi:hypothetical protein
MVAIRVFDPALCCSTGVCGPSVDPQLARFAADLDWLKKQGISVERFNLAQQPAAFAGDAEVKSSLETKGESGLPLVKVDGAVKSVGVYPSRDELASWSGLGAPTAMREPSAPASPRGAPSSPEAAPANPEAAPKPKSGGCCGPGKSSAGAPKKSGCC